MKRCQQPVFAQVLEKLDPGAICGSSIKALGLDPRLFDARPQAHSASTFQALHQLYDLMEKGARVDDRLSPDEPLIRGWSLSYDIYSPRFGRFIEVDEYQHFSRPRLSRLKELHSSQLCPLYPPYFWGRVIDRLMRSPARDLDPPHRDEARAYRDEVRERLPLIYGLAATIRLDEYSLREPGLSACDLILQTLEAA